MVDSGRGAVDNLFRGAPRYVAGSPWGPVSALLITLLACVISLAAIAVGVAVAISLGTPAHEIDSAAETMTSLATPAGLGATALFQLMSLAVIWVAAGRGGRRKEVLQLGGVPSPRLATYLVGAAVVVAVTSALELVFYFVVGYDPFADTKWLAEGLRSWLWLGTVIIAVVLAPLWEEFAFRGFLLSALAGSRLGFWPAALIVNTLWTLLHWGYSAPGIISVFVAGVLLSWLLWRTGSIWTAVAAHAVANTVAVTITYLFAPVA